MGIAIGLDLGSTAIKLAAVESKKLVYRYSLATAPGQESLANEMIAHAVSEMGISAADIEGVVATGYGKKLFSSATKTVDEISANARGAFLLSDGEARLVMNVGGQDMKVIFLGSSGEVIDFKMNDKCAAGTGRFFEQAARIVDTPLEEFGELCLQAEDAVELNSTCVVFAESEIVSLLSKGTPKEKVVKGLCASVARRAAAFLQGLDDMSGLYLDGGPAMNRGLGAALAVELSAEVRVLREPQFTVAYGAACFL